MDSEFRLRAHLELPSDPTSSDAALLPKPATRAAVRTRFPATVRWRTLLRVDGPKNRPVLTPVGQGAKQGFCLLNCDVASEGVMVTPDGPQGTTVLERGIGSSPWDKGKVVLLR